MRHGYLKISEKRIFLIFYDHTDYCPSNMTTLSPKIFKLSMYNHHWPANYINKIWNSLGRVSNFTLFYVKCRNMN